MAPLSHDVTTESCHINVNIIIWYIREYFRIDVKYELRVYNTHQHLSIRDVGNSGSSEWGIYDYISLCTNVFFYNWTTKCDKKLALLHMELCLTL